jgi:hypothetical protein
MADYIVWLVLGIVILQFLFTLFRSTPIVNVVFEQYYEGNGKVDVGNHTQQQEEFPDDWWKEPPEEEDNPS